MSGLPEHESSVIDEAIVAEPSRYAVVILNDDYTTVDFVVEVLMKFFEKNRTDAMEITQKVHHDGRGIAGIYSHDIAETKSHQLAQYARVKGHPLRSIVEEIGDKNS